MEHLPKNLIIDDTIIFNNAIHNAYYPERWKVAKVLPLFKKDKNSTDKASYRPISLTNSISKVFQKIIKAALDSHTFTNNIIPPNQFGFRSQHSTVHAMNKFLSDTNDYLHKGKIVGAVLIDLEKAFDSVWHNGLIYKLHQYKYDEHLILLITDMLTGASFSTWDGKNHSSLNFVIAEGLPQGTVTSPALFIIYNSEILNLFNLNSGNLTHSLAFADDLIIYASNSSPNAINSTLKILINSVNKYYLDWNLKINPTKSEFIIFRKTVNQISFKTVKQLKNQTLSITNPQSREEIVVPTKTTVKYLGMNLDHLLRLNIHHKTQLNKARKAFKAHHRLFYSKHLDPKAKVICYQLLIRPIISYAAPIWWNTGPTVMELFGKFERTCLKACLSKYRSSESNYKRKIKNKIIYNDANIPRIDCFTLYLTRGYFASYNQFGNVLMNSLRPVEGVDLERRAKNGYIPPEAFIEFDKLGIVQDHYNVPHLYHKSRHRANKAISISLEDYTPENRIYSWIIPKRDKQSNDRLSKQYWWLQENAVFIEDLKRRLKALPQRRMWANPTNGI